MTTGRPPRALVVAYDFPPHAAIGTMRTLRVVQRLAQEGWDVVVLTSDPRTFRPGTPIDETLLERVPAAVTVVRAGAFRGLERLKAAVRRRPMPATATAVAAQRGAPKPVNGSRGIFGRALDLVEAALAIPDHEAAWLMPAIVQGRAACRSWQPDVIYSSAPPWTGQLVARRLAAALACPWVADFRDPWSRAPWREDRREFVKRANIWLEQTVIRRADAVLFVTRANQHDFARFYGTPLSDRFHLVPSGCDPSEFAGLGTTPAPTPARFTLLHAGTLYGARNPLPLIRALAAAIDRGAIARDRFRLRLLGPINLPVDLPAECRRLGVEDVVEFVPRVTRRDSLREMVAASALLLVQPGTTVSVPGKAYEYLAAGRPLMALAEEGETAELVRASGIGVSVHPAASSDDIEAALLELIAIGSRPYLAPPAALYDGRVHAATATSLMRRLALQEAPGGLGATTFPPAAAAPLRPEEPTR